jgi:hypothetical protein
MHEHKKGALQLVLVIALAFGCSAATLSGTLAAMSVDLPAAAPAIS